MHTDPTRTDINRGLLQIWFVNLITLYRILAAPFLLYILFNDQLSVFKWMLLLSFSTDAIDGYLARKLNASTSIGAMLDSIGDFLTIIAAVAGIIHLHSEFVTEQRVIIISICSLFIFQMLFALIRYKRMSSFHTYLAKITAVLQGVFFLATFFFNIIYYPLFYIASFVTVISLIEEIILTGLIPQWKINVRGLYWYMINKIV